MTKWIHLRGKGNFIIIRTAHNPGNSIEDVMSWFQLLFGIKIKWFIIGWPLMSKICICVIFLLHSPDWLSIVIIATSYGRYVSNFLCNRRNDTSWRYRQIRQRNRSCWYSWSREIIEDRYVPHIINPNFIFLVELAALLEQILHFTSTLSPSQYMSSLNICEMLA